MRWFSAFIFIFFRCFVPKQQLLSRLLERAEKASQKEKEEKDALQLSWQWLLTNWWAGWSNHHRHKLSFKARNDELMDHDGRRNYDDRLALLDMVLWFCYVSTGIWSNIDYGNALRDICNASGNVVNPMMEVVGTWPTYCGLRQLQLSEELRELQSQVWILGYFGTFWRVCGRWSFFFLYIMVQYISGFCWGLWIHNKKFIPLLMGTIRQPTCCFVLCARGLRDAPRWPLCKKSKRSHEQNMKQRSNDWALGCRNFEWPTDSLRAWQARSNKCPEMSRSHLKIRKWTKEWSGGSTRTPARAGASYRMARWTITVVFREH